MKVTNISEFRKKTRFYLDEVIQKNERVVISRGKDNGVVMMSLKDYNKFSEETNHSNQKESSQTNSQNKSESNSEASSSSSFTRGLLDL